MCIHSLQADHRGQGLMALPTALRQEWVLKSLSEQQLLQVINVLTMMLHPDQNSRISLAELDVNAVLSTLNI